MSRKSSECEEYFANQHVTVDEETKKELAEMQNSAPMGASEKANALQNFDMAGWLAGKSN